MESRTIKTTQFGNLLIKEVKQCFQTDEGQVTRIRFFVCEIKKVDPPLALELNEFETFADAERQVEFLQRPADRGGPSNTTAA